jgi:peptide/nickel transport system permease protein
VLRFIFRRILMLVPVMVGVAFIVFTMLHFTPGDPARIILGEMATEESIRNLRTEMGLDDPFFIQFGRYLWKVINFDLGNSYATKSPVTREIFTALPATMKLASLAIFIAICIGVPVGIVSAVRQYSWIDNFVMLFAMLGTSMPVFWLSLLLILAFALHLGWFPSSGFETFSSMVLPAVAISTPQIALITRMTRSSMLEVIRQDYIRTARSKGQRKSVVVWKHALGNAMIPVITVIGLSFGSLLSGAVLTESIFSIPGVGRLMVEGIKTRDYPMVQGGVIYTAFLFCMVNLLVDIVYTFVDPRVKAQLAKR